MCARTRASVRACVRRTHAHARARAHTHSGAWWRIRCSSNIYLHVHIHTYTHMHRRIRCSSNMNTTRELRRSTSAYSSSSGKTEGLWLRSSHPHYPPFPPSHPRLSLCTHSSPPAPHPLLPRAMHRRTGTTLLIARLHKQGATRRHTT